ncbi:helix-turn-helix transcriptional regulator [Fundidesulfovibrio terrae]|uniref:helix-turn-helix transcriptional regulator n=1 Tax=Fundidesulfovibrio terrae TaxID=2922866 RepID=UPI001FAEB224|nr:LuxR family transcriptional regulator [Fundidesulfovibrio terrae]
MFPLRSIPEQEMSGDDAIVLLEIIQQCLFCTTSDEYHEIFVKLKKLFQFDHAFSGIAKLGTDSIISYNIENISYPADWLRVYYEKNFLESDVIINENFKSFSVQYWRQTYRRTPPPSEYVSISTDFGLTDGYTHGSRPFGQWKHASLFSFSSPIMKKLELRTVKILETIIPHLHQAISTFMHSRDTSALACKISKREREILRWLKDGKSSWDMSVILNISERTVNFHIYNILRKLNAVNRSQAVAQAIHCGLIEID